MGSAPKPTKRSALVAARMAAGFTQEELAARVEVEREGLAPYDQIVAHSFAFCILRLSTASSNRSRRYATVAGA